MAVALGLRPFAIYVESLGNAICMIQTNPANNVFEGTARRSW
ncbi:MULTISPECIES: hypothetical protein [Rhodanobacter]|nr:MULTISPECIES: hypothetical protein [Rhodanobacter]